MTLKDKLRLVAEVLQNTLKIHAPKDTWNLTLNGIRLVFEGEDIYIVIGGEVAPYAVYTNEPWEGRTNPNEGWIQRALQESRPTIKSIMEGVYTREEIEEIKQGQEQHLDAILQEHIDRRSV